MSKITSKSLKIALNPECKKGHFQPRLAAILSTIFASVIMFGSPRAFSQNPPNSPDNSPANPAVNAPLNLPHLGEDAQLSLGEEAAIGQRLVATLWRDPDYVDDAPLHAYVDGIWQPLLAASAARGHIPEALQRRFGWQLLLGRDASINAFAMPGGWVGVHLGLIAAVGSRDEVASVLAHELSHITQRHIARLHASQSRSTPLMVAGLILGALAAARSPDTAQALIVGSQAAAAQNYLGFSRDMEREADRVGFSVLEGAGFAPEGAMRMFARLQSASRINDNGAWPYLRTHPLTGERMADMQTRAQQRGLAGVVFAENSLEINDINQLEHALAAQRARLLAKPDVALLGQIAHTGPKTGAALTQRLAQLYARALAQAQLRQKTQALAQWKKLWALWNHHFENPPQNQMGAMRQIIWLGAQLQLENQNPHEALALLAKLDARGKSETSPQIQNPTSALKGDFSTRGLGKNQAENAQNAPIELGGFSENAAGEFEFKNAAGIVEKSAPFTQSPATIAARPTLLLRTRALIDAQRAAEAIAPLQTWLAAHAGDAPVWLALAQAQEAAGNMLAALRAQGEARAAQFDWAGAADRFTAAQDWARGLSPRMRAADHVLASIIDTRLRAVQQSLREQAREQ